MNLRFLSTTMFTSFAARTASAFTQTARPQARSITGRAFAGSNLMFAKEGQAEVILVGCGQPNKGMGWYRKFVIQNQTDDWLACHVMAYL
jgi:hypothetical protein